VLTDTKQNCILQAQRVSEYADWAHLKVNQSKTTVTGILHKTSPQDPMHNRMLQNQLQDQVMIQRKHIQYVNPKTPFKFLGVWLRMDLNWTKQFTETRETLQKAVNGLGHSLLTTQQKVRILNTCIRRILA